jgi:threonyl-tRNA synthetase
MLIVGGREVENRTVAVRTRTGEDLGSMPLDELIARLHAELGERGRVH